MKNLKLIIRHLIKLCLRKDIIVRTQINSKTSWFGNKHAGFFVCTDKLNNNSVVYSFGIGEDISFDLELIKHFHCTVYGFDPTPKSIKFIRNKKDLPNNYKLKEYAIYNYDGKIKFLMPDNPDYVSCTALNLSEGNIKTENIIEVPCKKFDTIMKELGHKNIDIIKMDIEGSEYYVLNDILNSNIIIDQIIIEFHHRFPNIGIAKTKEAIAKLNNSGYKIAAISDNYEEFTFMKTNNF